MPTQQDIIRFNQEVKITLEAIALKKEREQKEEQNKIKQEQQREQDRQEQKEEMKAMRKFIYSLGSKSVQEVAKETLPEFKDLPEPEIVGQQDEVGKELTNIFGRMFSKIAKKKR